jgi:hypothetical protein
MEHGEGFGVLILDAGNWRSVLTMFFAGVAATFGICTLWFLVAVLRAPLMSDEGSIRLVKDETV